MAKGLIDFARRTLRPAAYWEQRARDAERREERLHTELAELRSDLVTAEKQRDGWIARCRHAEARLAS